MSDFRGGLKSDDRKDRTHAKVTTKHPDLEETHPRASLSLLSWQPGEPLRALKKDKSSQGWSKADFINARWKYESVQESEQ